ncbi:MAG: DUF6339 family protein [Desulfobulbus sp.]|nr:DUF6339 family protein [Desulfobulbus sp.]
MGAIIDKYGESGPWLDSYFGSSAWAGETNRDMPELIALKIPEGNLLFDLENTKTIYSALQHLPLTLAIDERFWAYLTHVVFWDYMRARWPLEKALKTKVPANYIREHYFFMGNRDRALIRNGISRLWWYGYLSYDAERENPYELTEVLLEKLDIAQQLLERSYSRNVTITKTILSMMFEKRVAKTPFSHREKQFRPLMVHLNAIGGVTILDALVEADIRAIVEEKLSQLDPLTEGDETESESEMAA